MRAETLAHQRPPTPPNISTEPRSSIHQVVRYISDQSYSFDEPRHPSSAYGSPSSVSHEGISQHPSQGFLPSHLEGHPGSELGLGVQYDTYGQNGPYYEEGQYSGLTNNQAMFSGSPPTPRSATDNDDAARRTRSGRQTVTASPSRNDDKSRPKAAPRPKKPKAAKKDKPKTPKLTAPLSVLTKDLTSIPVRNMEEWVSRSAEVRRKEAEKRNGYITRPMNSFMLYRSAYAERTKQWCLQNNHQIVSSVSGESWPLEPPEIRELYNEYAKLERINHQNAHPTYKFSPSKTVPPPRKRKGEFCGDRSPSDLDDVEWAPGYDRSKRRQSRQLEQRLDTNLSYTNGLHPDFYEHHFGPNDSGINKSAWEMTNQGRPMPMAMGQGELYHQYFHTPLYPNMAMSFGPGMMEDMQMRRMGNPGSSVQFSPGHSLLALPGGNAVDLMQSLHSHDGTPLGEEPQVDPMLLAFDGYRGNIDSSTMTQHPEFRNGYAGLIDGELDRDGVHSFPGTTPSLEDFHSRTWQPDPGMMPMEQGSEFEKWMDDQHAI